MLGGGLMFDFEVRGRFETCEVCSAKWRVQEVFGFHYTGF